MTCLLTWSRVHRLQEPCAVTRKLRDAYTLNDSLLQVLILRQGRNSTGSTDFYLCLGSAESEHPS